MNKIVNNCEYIQKIIKKVREQYISEIESDNFNDLSYNKYLIRVIQSKYFLEKDLLELFINNIDLLYYLKFVSLSNKNTSLEKIQKDLIDIKEGYKKNLKIYCNNDYYEENWNRTDIDLLKKTLIEYLEIE